MPELANQADLAHLHLLLNHFPTIGTILGLGLLLLAFVRKNDHLKKVSLEVMFLIALATLPVYVSGQAAAEALKGQAGVSADAIALHNDAALGSFIMMEITGFFAWLTLWRIRRVGRPTTGLTYTVLVLSVLTAAAVARAANMGGDIRHPEIEGGQYAGLFGAAAAPGSGFISAAGIKDFVLQHPFVWPACETLHFLGMSLMFGVLMIVNLRLLGFLRGMSFASVHRLLPFGLIGFGINFITGMFFFVAASEQYTQNVAFHYKVVLLMLAGVNYLVLTVYDEAWALPASADAPLSGKLLGGSALVLAVGVMYFGRMLPFIGNAF
ncbi:MAG TPA: hypothetical protein VEP46_14670 [Vicinamibacterales bacterium]|jgi:uncharacterized membrane protein|nr:hypothetical protein [Vicinamibacterales bacterium]